MIRSKLTPHELLMSGLMHVSNVVEFMVTSDHYLGGFKAPFRLPQLNTRLLSTLFFISASALVGRELSP